MDEHVEIGRHRTASVLALFAAATLAAITMWCAGQAWPLNRENPTAMTTSAFLVLAGAASARLTVACLMAALQLRAEFKHAEGMRTSVAAARPHGPRPASRRRAASLFLAVAALTASAAATAGATPLTRTSTTAQVPGVSSSGALDAQELDGPGFALFHTPSDLASPDFPRGTAPSPSAPDDECTLPAPGWTPPSAMTATTHCRLLLGAGDSHATKTSHVVLRGETLWGIASSYLPQNSSAEQVAAALPSWIEANPSVSSHPDVLHVGDVLTIPTHVMTGATR